MLIASPAGGMDIEDVAVNSPELIKKIPIDIFEGITDKVALDVAKFLNFNEPLASVVRFFYIIIFNVFSFVYQISQLFMLITGSKRNTKVMAIFFVS